MCRKWLLAAAVAALFSFAGFTVYGATDAPAGGAAITPQALQRIVPGQSTKADIASLFGAPWRVVQFNDCGEAMDDQADETWEYRGSDPSGAFRLHVEFSDQGVVHLIAKIPDKSLGGKGTVARVAPGPASSGMSM